MEKIYLSIYDYAGKRLCDLYASDVQMDGQAFDIEYTEDLTGNKTLLFSISKTLSDGTENEKWSYLKNKYLISYTVDDYKDWFVIDSVSSSLDNSGIDSDVTCSHVSMSLSKRNVYLVIDDTNGIGTINYLMNLVLNGTGWTLGECDTFYESDGSTEKIRSITSEGKEGALALITKICNIFNAYPVFNGNEKTVDIFSKKEKTGFIELTYEKNMTSIKVLPSSNTLTTRLYVEGQYDEDGYIGIESVNPTGLTFIMNFDYFNEIGMLSTEHQNAIDTYIENMSQIVTDIKTLSAAQQTRESELSELWGAPKIVIYTITGVDITDTILFGGATEEDAEIIEGDKIIIADNDSYVTVTAGSYGAINIPLGTQFLFKYVTPAYGGYITAKEVAIEAKQKMVTNLTEDIENETSDEKIMSMQQQISTLNAEIEIIETSLFELFFSAVAKVNDWISTDDEITALIDEQKTTENTFVNTMGELLQDGYWSNENYILGQEQFLYDDAVEYLKVISRPEVGYEGDVIDLSSLTGYEVDKFKINMSARIYNQLLGINEYVTITKRIVYPLAPWKNTIEFSNKEMDIQGQTLESVFNRITDVANQLLGKNGLINRASAINKNKTLNTELLNGIINLEKQRLFSTVSGLSTDENGNQIYEAIDGSGAMMISGNGFMIANGKNADGTWNWRTFGTPNGFNADMLIAGFISSERIETNSLSVNKLESNAGLLLDINNNQAITSIVDKISKKTTIFYQNDTPTPENIGDLWYEIDTSPVNIRKWDGETWEIVTDVILSAALKAAGDAKTIADGKIKTFVQDTEPEEDVSAEGDLWINTADYNGLYRYSGAGWIPYVDTYARTVFSFESDGLHINDTGSGVYVVLGPTKLSFKDENDFEVAYISNNKLYITNAQITENMQIGGFQFVKFDTGRMSIKWVG